MSKTQEIQVWWHGIAALPADRQDHAYHVLRRVWGDHTIAGARSFYRWGSEDNVTPALFQNWALFSDPNSVAPLIRAAGGSVGSIRKVQWAYACEETLDAHLQPHHGRNFITPDIILAFEDEQGVGLLVFEVKRPGKAADEMDGRKLMSYCDLPSTRKIRRRFECFLIGAKVAEKSRESCGGVRAVLRWEQLAELQMVAVQDVMPAGQMSDLVTRWIGRSFTRYGIPIPQNGAPPLSVGARYGSEDSYQQIDLLALPESVRRFLKGSECVEAIWRGEQPPPPLSWLSAEPTIGQIRSRGLQTTEDRRVCRWRFDWDVSRERTWR